MARVVKPLAVEFQRREGGQQACPPTTTTYEMLVLMRNGTTTALQVTRLELRRADSALAVSFVR